MTTGERLKELRQKANLTLQDAGELIGTSKQNLFKYENDIITNIPIDRLVKLAEIYNSSPIEILGWEHYSNIPNSTKASIYNYLPYGVSAGLPEGPDYDVDFEKIERKLKSGDYRSSKKSYNVIKEFYLILYLFIFFLLQFYHLLYQSLLHFL